MDEPRVRTREQALDEFGTGVKQLEDMIWLDDEVLARDEPFKQFCGNEVINRLAHARAYLASLPHSRTGGRLPHPATICASRLLDQVIENLDIDHATVEARRRTANFTFSWQEPPTKRGR